jgi:elongation factor G
MGELHLEIIVDRMKREFGSRPTSAPQVAYRETIRKTVEQEGKFVRQSGGRGQYGHVWLRLEPLEPARVTSSSTASVAVPREVHRAGGRQGRIQEQMENGVMAGFPVVDVKVTLFDGSYHEVDSNEMAFKIAGIMGFKDGMRSKQARSAGADHEGRGRDPRGLHGRRDGRPQPPARHHAGHGRFALGQGHRAEVPLAEMFGYATDLRSATQGRATYSMEFKPLLRSPRNIAETVIKKAS